MDRAALLELVGRVAGVHALIDDREHLLAAATDLGRLQSWVAAKQAAITTALARVRSFPEKTLADTTHIPFRDAEHLVERAALLETVPPFAIALEAGDITTGHVDALQRAVRRLEPDQRTALLDTSEALADHATHVTPETFTRRLRADIARLRRDDGTPTLTRQQRATRLHTWVDPDTGMWCLRGEFDPATGVHLQARLNAMVERLFRDHTPDTAPTDPAARQDHLRALALVELTKQGRVTTGGRPEIVPVLDLDAPAGDGGPTIDWGLPVEIPYRYLAELAGTADINAIVTRHGTILHAPGNLNMGRTTRIANRAQRRALRGLYRTCAIPDCSVHYDHCKLHHIIWWRHGGRTDLDNLLPVCSRHHHNIHDDGWGIELGRNRELTLRTPDGHTTTTGPPHRRAA